jgi:glycosyltransferase involved in cell wall biosynthesis
VSDDGLVFCTIVAKNYLAFARVLAGSLRRHHPGARVVVLLVDRVDSTFDAGAEPFEVVEAESLGNIPDFPAFAFKYSLLEISTAVKPFFLARLLEQQGVGKLVYLDPDIQVFRPLDRIAELLDQHAILLTPHLTDPIEDDLHPSELAILQAGAYNLGFLALARGPQTAKLLAWWQARVYDQCVVDIEKGLFVDQKWMDLAPGLFAGVHVLVDPGYNVAYWNLHGRRVTLTSAEPPRVNGGPLYFFHFSGVDPDELGPVSRHQNRFTLGSLGEARRLFLDYRELLLRAGYRETAAWPYAYARFDNGVSIPDAARQLYFSLGPRRTRFGDPFATAGDSFFAWANAPVRGADPPPFLSRLLEHLHRSRSDLLLAFPDAAGRDLGRFADWLAEGGSREYRLAEVFLQPLAPLLQAPAPPPAAAAGRARAGLRRVWTSPLGRQLKFRLKRTLGPRRVEAIKRRLPALARQRPLEPYEREPLARLAIARFGVNVAGYISAESGMGEGVRGVIRALRHAGVPHTLHNLDLGVVSRQDDRSFGVFSSAFDYDINLLFVNADQVPHVAAHLGGERFRHKVNVGFWLWELEEFPRAWSSSFDYFHEIWTPSRFCLDALSAASPVPVRRVGLPVDFAPPPALTRERFGLAVDRFAFLFVFDSLSHLERKNPFALVRAFQRAFRPEDPVQLVLKTINSDVDPEGAERLRREAHGWPILVLDEYLDKDAVHALMALADCYVSLHRSEGFGLTLAEAMRLGKPVIATDYSGSADFLNAGTGLPVRYRLVEIARDAGPYERGRRWAEPDTEHAAELMRWAVGNPDALRELGRRAGAEISARHDVAAVSRTLVRRLRRLVEQVNGPRGEHFGLPAE